MATKRKIHYSTNLNVYKMENNLSDKQLVLFTRFIEQYVENNFNISKTCEDIKMNRLCYYRYYRQYPEFRDMIAEAKQGIVDRAEQVIMSFVNSGDLDAAKFVLTKLGKKRDWSQDQNIDITSNGQSLAAVINIIKPDDKTD